MSPFIMKPMKMCLIWPDFKATTDAILSENVYIVESARADRTQRPARSFRYRHRVRRKLATEW